LSVARAQSCQQIEETLVFHLALTKLHKVDDSLLGDLLVEQHFIVFKQLGNSLLCSEVVLLVRRHRLVEVELDVLRDIELVVVIVFDAVLQ
jgi:hypothetical protein